VQLIELKPWNKSGQASAEPSSSPAKCSPGFPVLDNSTSIPEVAGHNADAADRVKVSGKVFDEGDPTAAALLSVNSAKSLPIKDFVHAQVPAMDNVIVQGAAEDSAHPSVAAMHNASAQVPAEDSARAPVPTKNAVPAKGAAEDNTVTPVPTEVRAPSAEPDMNTGSALAVMPSKKSAPDSASTILGAAASHFPAATGSCLLAADITVEDEGQHGIHTAASEASVSTSSHHEPWIDDVCPTENYLILKCLTLLVQEQANNFALPVAALLEKLKARETTNTLFYC
jgi:hypothetical protein